MDKKETGSRQNSIQTKRYTDRQTDKQSDKEEEGAIQKLVKLLACASSRYECYFKITLKIITLF